MRAGSLVRAVLDDCRRSTRDVRAPLRTKTRLRVSRRVWLSDRRARSERDLPAAVGARRIRPRDQRPPEITLIANTFVPRWARISSLPLIGSPLRVGCLYTR